MGIGMPPGPRPYCTDLICGSHYVCVIYVSFLIPYVAFKASAGRTQHAVRMGGKQHKKIPPAS